MPSLTSVAKADRMYPAYAHSSFFFLSPEPDYDAMEDAEFERMGGTNSMRAEIEAQFIAAEIDAGRLGAALDSRCDRLVEIVTLLGRQDPATEREPMSLSMSPGGLDIATDLWSAALFLKEWAAKAGRTRACSCACHADA